MHIIALLFHAYLYLKCLERGGLEWSCLVAEDNSLDCFIRIYYMILLYKINILSSSDDIQPSTLLSNQSPSGLIL